jgi:hypothetical protein
MVEALCVISVFIMFFLGMVYFSSLYHGKLRVQDLSRAAAVAYAMNACQPSNNPTAAIQQDLNGTTSNPPPQGNGPPPNAGAGSSNSSVTTNKGSKSVSTLLGNKGFAGFQVDALNVGQQVAATTQGGLFSPRTGFQGNVASNSFVACGDKQGKGDFKDAFGFIKDLF